ncbi:MAG: trypsin-like peptidase domain-containing protein [Desulfobacteraceae bacterium]|jgi:S1-C subfamily serine protease|nr:trypsin-like peptidase domain-containing protein [Desulfobacteraceae bacterium]
MKLCQGCGQLLAEDISTCPVCGNDVDEGRKTIDDYRIIEVLHEGYATTLCRAVKEDTEESVMIRIFSPQSGVDEKIAERLKNELEELKKLPEEYFVRHFEIRKSSDGLWYRVSEWLDTENWGNLIASGVFQDYRVAFQLFYRIASILEGLHRIGHFIPHLILDDILVVKGDDGELKIKIDYKLSRFFDPKLDRPGPTLQRLLSCHPDIINQRPLDFRSDIWSLGKIFVELLTAEHDSTDFQAEIDALSLPPEFAVLLKAMLADDPNLRPQSMAEVAESLSRIKEEEIESAMHRRRETMQPPVQEIRSLKKRIGQLALVIGVVAILAILAWFFFVFRQKDTEKIFGEHANRYAKSVAFVLTEYWLTAGDSRVYQKRGEGTAFLVDNTGYLLTNRHVVCPWLEDGNLHLWIRRLMDQQSALQLNYRVFLWFEGEKAFNRLLGLSKSAELDDIYRLSAAFRTDGQPRLAIAGVARWPDRTWQLIQSPLKDDFAVLKIDRVPEGLYPLPLDEKMEALKVPKLSPVIALGFPLGSRTQEATVNVSVTQGHVRRAFENLLQMDTSIHPGNSGGPVIDLRGKVIGIASSVALDWIAGPVPVATPLSDMGMVLPINKAAVFLRELKAGKVKWNGVLDLSVNAKIKKIMDLADKRRWSEAQALADQELQTSFDPTLLLTAAMIHFCAADHEKAGPLFEKALSMDDKNDQARLLLFLIDWLADRSTASPYGRELLALDWRSPNEFFGYLVRALEGKIAEDRFLRGGYTDYERHWLRYVAALVADRNHDTAKAEKLLQPVVLMTGHETWLHFLALARLEKTQQQKLASIEDLETRRQYQSQLDQFAQMFEKSRPKLAKRQALLAPLLAKLEQDSLAPNTKRAMLEQALNIDPANGDLLVEMVFYCAMEDDWDSALEYTNRFFSLDGRENAGQLQVGLLKAEILYNLGRKEAALAELKTFLDNTEDAWYRSIAECLLDQEKEKTLTQKAGESPEYLLTGHMALAFWAEGNGDKGKAIDHYREALGSYMDDMIEYVFAVERIKRLRQPPQ